MEFPPASYHSNHVLLSTSFKIFLQVVLSNMVQDTFGRPRPDCHLLDANYFPWVLYGSTSVCMHTSSLHSIMHVQIVARGTEQLEGIAVGHLLFTSWPCLVPA